MDYFFLGDPELVTAFRFVGIHGVSAPNADYAREVFYKIIGGSGGSALDFRRDAPGTKLPSDLTLPSSEQCHVLIITEEVADWLGDLLVKWQLLGRYPLIVEMPGILGRHADRKTLVDSIREAIGVHV